MKSRAPLGAAFLNLLVPDLRAQIRVRNRKSRLLGDRWVMSALPLLFVDDATARLLRGAAAWRLYGRWLCHRSSPAMLVFGFILRSRALDRLRPIERARDCELGSSTPLMEFRSVVGLVYFS
jgi:hypothetical protein